MTTRNVEDSRVVMTEIVMPNDTNPLGNCMGGRVMHLIDVAAAISARRHARTTCVTAAIDEIVFHEAVPMGSVLVLMASVNLACRTSMEVGVRVELESLKSGIRRHCASAYLTFVALDETGRPTPVPGLKADTKDELRRLKAAETRRKMRLERRRARGKRD
ncbi:MAG: acyl-CoA thioesterase [Planctomycetota bacterium]|nr:acyl-CoA thioesterase [Planctomycetota bacterium]